MPLLFPASLNQNLIPLIMDLVLPSVQAICNQGYHILASGSGAQDCCPESMMSEMSLGNLFAHLAQQRSYSCLTSLPTLDFQFACIFHYSQSNNKHANIKLLCRSLLIFLENISRREITVKTDSIKIVSRSVTINLHPHQLPMSAQFILSLSIIYF